MKCGVILRKEKGQPKPALGKWYERTGFKVISTSLRNQSRQPFQQPAVLDTSPTTQP